MKPQLIINADDFGKDTSVTRAIMENLSAGRLTSASIMANGESFQEACAMVRDSKLTNKLGVHLVLDEGVPLSEEMRTFTNDDGQMCLKRKPFFIEQGVLSAVYSELRAQIESVITQGITPTHLDSHRHFHVSFSIARIMVALAKEFGIRHIRLARNLACHGAVHARVYKWFYNAYLSRRVVTTDRFTDLFAFYETFRDASGLKGSVECMCHLDASERGLRDRAFLESVEFDYFASGYDLIDYSRLT
jgi:chitin disaccharide deacetylase